MDSLFLWKVLHLIINIIKQSNILSVLSNLLFEVYKDSIFYFLKFLSNNKSTRLKATLK